MRIISQDGSYDIPYEQVVIQRYETKIYYLNANLVGVENVVSDAVIAEYTTEEKAIKAMEMMQAKYQTYYKTTRGLMTTTEFAFVHPKVFRFPRDNEVEG